VLTPAVGRAKDQADLAAALGESRWVTVVGPPGSGKTLLTRHVVANRPGVAWVNADQLEGADAVVRACLDALEVEPAPGDHARAVLTRSLDDQETLLVVDGLGADVSEMGELFQEIVETTTHSAIATTATTVAGRPRERVVRVGPLALPPRGSVLSGPAYDLLRTRLAAAGAPTDHLDEQVDDVRRLLVATGGLPLLIEQVAVQIALVGMTNVVPTASLSEAVHASYQLLTTDQQRAFRRISAMKTPVGLDVIGDITDAVDRSTAATLAYDLVRRSLLQVERDGRFDMLAPIRRHGAFLIASTDDAARARDGLLRWAERVVPTDVNVGGSDAPWLADLPVMRSAIEAAVASPATRDRGYALANAIFSTLYTAMRAREAVEILEGVLTSGDGPSTIGAQVARRAGIAASEVRGTYEGLWLLDRAEKHADAAPDPAMERARNASIRAEMHLDAGDLDAAEDEARRAIALGTSDPYIRRQARRTLVDIAVSRGDFGAAEAIAERVMTAVPPEQRWMALSAQVLLGQIAVEQGRVHEAVSAGRAAYESCKAIAEDRIGLLAETLLRQVDDRTVVSPVDRESLPWAVRLGVLLQDARQVARSGDPARGAGQAADVVVLADSARLGRDGIQARLVLADALMAMGDHEQAESTYLSALDRAARCPMPLRAADALDGLAAVAIARGLDQAVAGCLMAGAAVLRAPRRAVAWGGASWHNLPALPSRLGSGPSGWVVDGQLTPLGVEQAAALMSGEASPGVLTATWAAAGSADGPGAGGHGAAGADSALPGVSAGAGGHGHHPFGASAAVVAALTRSELAVAEQVAAGLTNRQIAEALFVSPRTVDAHLSHIYRKLEIPSRARLAALMSGSR